jgi:hypothetical protein
VPKTFDYFSKLSFLGRVKVHAEQLRQVIGLTQLALETFLGLSDYGFKPGFSAYYKAFKYGALENAANGAQYTYYDPKRLDTVSVLITGRDTEPWFNFAVETVGGSSFKVKFNLLDPAGTIDIAVGQDYEVWEYSIGPPNPNLRVALLKGRSSSASRT